MTNTHQLTWTDVQALKPLVEKDLVNAIQHGNVNFTAHEFKPLMSALDLVRPEAALEPLHNLVVNVVNYITLIINAIKSGADLDEANNMIHVLQVMYLTGLRDNTPISAAVAA